MSKKWKQGTHDAHPFCFKQTPFTDDEGFYDSFLCMKDWRACDCKCEVHRPQVNELVRPFFDSLNRSLR